MPVTSILVLAGIVGAFMLFGVVLVWAERQTSHTEPVQTRLEEAVPALPLLKKAA
jgi:hypothetical protein